MVPDNTAIMQPLTQRDRTCESTNRMGSLLHASRVALSLILGGYAHATRWGRFNWCDELILLRNSRTRDHNWVDINWWVRAIARLHRERCSSRIVRVGRGGLDSPRQVVIAALERTPSRNVRLPCCGKLARFLLPIRWGNQGGGKRRSDILRSGGSFHLHDAKSRIKIYMDV
jgi:hypothetical protein